ncbi:hypothetical protein AB0G05_07560 [Nonomuraea wenchangensis]|uniref:hypothetical protein n=1 Tax=Nonomuraea wenchangensis TaxID=568860 RepID=UPI003473122B
MKSTAWPPSRSVGTFSTTVTSKPRRAGREASAGPPMLAPLAVLGVDDPVEPDRTACFQQQQGEQRARSRAAHGDRVASGRTHLQRPCRTA